MMTEMDIFGGGGGVYEEYIDASAVTAYGNYTVQCGFQPSKIWITGLYTPSMQYVMVNYDSSISAQQLYTQGSTVTAQYKDIGQGNAGRIEQINATNFVIYYVGQCFTDLHVIAMP